MNFAFTEQAHTSRINVWYDNIYIGEIFVLLTERKDIDWSKYRADKTLRMSPRERYKVKYIPTAKIPDHPAHGLSACSSRKEAAEKILEYHRSCVNAE